jgi:hypothetical protein
MHPTVPNRCRASIGGDHARHGKELGCACEPLILDLRAVTLELGTHPKVCLARSLASSRPREVMGADSNPLIRRQCIPRSGGSPVRLDSPLEERGFEFSVPLAVDGVGGTSAAEAPSRVRAYPVLRSCCLAPCLALGAPLLVLPAIEFKDAPALHLWIEHFQGLRCRRRPHRHVEIGEAFEDAEQVLVPGTSPDLHINPSHRPAGRFTGTAVPVYRRSARMCQCQEPGRRCSSWVSDRSSKPAKSAARPAKSQ